MSRRLLVVLLLLAAGGRVHAQGVLGDVFSGKLINPEVGVWAWYELTDKASGAKYYLRQAIVGKEEVKNKDGFWVETELVPQEGFSTIYKMLLTGPANDPKNIHQLFLKQGKNPPESVAVPQDGMAGGNEGARTLVGPEKIKTTGGEEVEAQHYTIGGGGVQQADVWLNDSVRPLGIVKMVSSEGELILQRTGMGGKDAASVIDAYAKELPAPGTGNKVEVRVNGEKQDMTPAPAGKPESTAAPGGAPAPGPEKAKPATPPKRSRKSKSGEKTP